MIKVATTKKVILEEIKGYLVLNIKAIHRAEMLHNERLVCSHAKYLFDLETNAELARKAAQDSAKLSAAYVGVPVDLFIDMVNDPEIIDEILAGFL